MNTKTPETGSQSARLEERIDELRDIGLSVDLLESLGKSLSHLRLARYGPGETIYREGSGVEALYIVLGGRIKLMNYTADGNARIVRLHKRGSVLGLNVLLDEKHDHTAIAIDEVSLYVLPKQTIGGIQNEDPEAYARLLEYSHEYLKQADTWIVEFTSGGIRGRVARLVLFLMSQDESTDKHEVALLTVNEMAEIIGVTPESVSRIMADFKRSRILTSIDEENPDIFRCDKDALMKEARS
jgi:CRP/FNR family transcriptional regulator